MADPYVSAGDLAQSISLPENVAETDATRAVNAASRAVEQLCQRRSFHLDAASTTRTYTATGASFVRIDDATSITEVRSGGTVVAALAHPLNAAVDGQPYLWVASDGRFSTVPGAIEVDATFGWPAVPEQVKQFVTIVASKLLKRTREAPFGVVQVGGMEGQAVRLAKSDPDAMLLIEPLIRNYPAVA